MKATEFARGARAAVKQELQHRRFRLLQPSLKINPANNDKVAVYVGKNLIYNRIKKSGNTSVLLFLDEILYGARHLSGDYFDAKTAALARTSTPFQLPVREIRNIDSYFTFTFFRNPYIRCLSMFLNKVAPAKRSIYSAAGGFGDRSPAGFAKFVHFLSDAGVRVDQHFYPQTHLLFFEPSTFAHIGKLENLDDELRYICDRANLLYPAGLTVSRPHQLEVNVDGRVTDAAAKLDMFYTGDLADRVLKLYRTDFEVGGYDTDPPM